MVGRLLNKGADGSSTPVGGYGADTELSKEEFQELLTSIDAGLRGLPATAQVPTPFHIREVPLRTRIYHTTLHLSPGCCNNDILISICS